MKLLTLTFVTVCLAIAVCDKYFKSTTEFIEKVHDESSAETICFVGVNDKFLKVFLKTHPYILVVMFKSHPVNIKWNGSKRLYGHVLIVLEAISENPNDIEVLGELIPQLGVRNFVIVISKDFARLQQYFVYLWKNKFRRTFGIVNGTSYAHFPHGNSTIIKLENMNPLPNAQKNLNGQAIRTAIKLDVPRSFWYTNEKGVKEIGGFVAQVIVTFLNKYNGTLIHGLNRSFDKMDEIKALVAGELDVTLNPYIAMKGSQFGYPVKLSRATIMVPLRGFLDPNQYFLRPFSLTVWACIGITCMYIIIMNILVNILMGKPSEIWHSFTQMYLTMLNMSLDQENTGTYRFKFIQRIFAFIIVNFYLVYLTSFLTVFIKVKEYDSVQDLIDDDFPMMVSTYGWNYTDHKIFPDDVEKIVVIVDQEEFNKARYSMRNTSYAYGMGVDAFHFLNTLVSRYSKPKFKLLSENLNQAFIGFIWAEHAPLLDALGDFTIRIFDYGLLIKWTQDSVTQGAEIMKQSLNIQPEPYNILFPLTFTQLNFAWTSLLLGLTSAFLVFLTERFGVVWWKYSQRKWSD